MKEYIFVDHLIADRRSGHSLAEVITNFLNSPRLLIEYENPFDLIFDLHRDDYLDCSTEIWQTLPTTEQIKYAKMYQDWYAKKLLNSDSNLYEYLGKDFKYGGYHITFKLIPPMCYIMGSPATEEDHYPDEGQQIILIKKAFWMSTTPITHLAWTNVMKTFPSIHAGHESPVDSVSFSESKDFCKRIDARLPTEKEWEMACRAGTTSMFSFGDNVDDLQHYAWYVDNSEDHPHTTGLKGSNAFGLFDMHGNVSEWCNARLEYDHYPRNYADRHVKRGGNFASPATRCRSAERGFVVPGDKFDYVGFRVVKDIKKR